VGEGVGLGVTLIAEKAKANLAKKVSVRSSRMFLLSSHPKVVRLLGFGVGYGVGLSVVGYGVGSGVGLTAV
jgi:hypothetical protein